MCKNGRKFRLSQPRGNKRQKLVFDELMERFTGQIIQFDFIADEKGYLVVECRNILVMAQ